MAAMVEVKCKSCKGWFKARVADRKRGWGRYCSKSCKAIKQEQQTGQYKEYLQARSASERFREDEDHWAANEHPFSSEGLGQWLN